MSYEVPARSDATKLYVQLRVGEPEVIFDWTGGPGAHHAIIDEGERQHHAYGSSLSNEISVYDAKGNLLGSLDYTHWS